jgi:hypothetical protein
MSTCFILPFLSFTENVSSLAIDWWVYPIKGRHYWQCFAGLNKDIVLCRRTSFCDKHFAAMPLFPCLTNATDCNYAHLYLCERNFLILWPASPVLELKCIHVLYVSYTGLSSSKQKQWIWNCSTRLPIVFHSLFLAMFSFSNQHPSQ